MDFQSAMVKLYRAPLMEPFPPGTEWWVDDDGRILHWDMRRDRYRTVLITRFRDTGRVIATNTWLYSQELDAAERSDQVMQEAIYRKIKLLQQRHWMALCYDRGGYC
jgi:nicotinamide riboside kinase